LDNALEEFKVKLLGLQPFKRVYAALIATLDGLTWVFEKILEWRK